MKRRNKMGKYITDEEKIERHLVFKRKRVEKYKNLSSEEQYGVFTEQIEGYLNNLIYQRGTNERYFLDEGEIFDNCSLDLKSDYDAVAPEKWRQRVRNEMDDLFRKVESEMFN